MMTEQMIGLLLIPYIMPDYPIHKAQELLVDDTPVPAPRRIETRKFAPGVSPAELSGSGFWQGRKVTPLHKRRSHNAQFRTPSGRTKGAKHSSYTHIPEVPESLELLQNDILEMRKTAKKPLDNPENYPDSGKLAGLPGMPPKKRQLADFVDVLTDSSMTDAEQRAFLPYRAEKPVNSVYVDGYAPVKIRVPHSRQEAG